MVEILFWVCAFLVTYTFVGYGILGFVLGSLRKKTNPHTPLPADSLPKVSVIVAAFNEREYIVPKIKNTQELDYPKEQLEIIIVADGSTDGTQTIAAEQVGVTVLFEPERRGKTAALNRAIPQASGEIIVLTDANAEVNPDALQWMIRHFQDSKVGGVSGEKKVCVAGEDDAVSSGEGAYWKYEAFLKRVDNRLSTLMGAPGELFAFRKDLFQPIKEDTILDDFMLSMNIVLKNLKLVYEPKAQAWENASASVGEEIKRKVRICAGGWQAMTRLPKAFCFTPNLLVSFIFISHRVFRWAVAPFLLPVIFVLNGVVATQKHHYLLLFIAQLAFYILAWLGYIAKSQKLKWKFLFIPYYFWVMNYCAILGFVRFVSGKQKATWARSERK